MIVRHSMLVMVAILGSCLMGHAASPQTRPETSDSAAFTAFNEPWQKDLIRSVPPAYSRADRAAWREGRGVFHLALDSKRGVVVQVTVKRSTGHKTLDAAADIALKQWRFRPGTWSSIDIPVTFVMAKTHRDYLEKIRRSQQQERTL